MRRLLSLILIVSLMLCTLSVSADESVMLSISSAECEQGDEVTVSVRIGSNSLACGGSFIIKYDSSRLEIKSANKGTAFNNINLIINKNYEADKMKFVWFGSKEPEGGEVVNLTFKALYSGSAYVDFEDVKLSDINAESISYTHTNGIITIDGNEPPPSPTPDVTEEPALTPSPEATKEPTPSMSPTDEPIASQSPVVTASPLPTTNPTETPKPSTEPRKRFTPIGKYIGKVEIAYDKDDFIVTTLDDSVDLNGITLYLAEYENNGVLKSVHVGTTDISDNILYIEDIKSETDVYKYFLWDKNQVPLIEAIDNL